MPAIGLPWVKAKIDTGARTSSLHAENLVEFERDAREWVRFTVRPWQSTTEDSLQVECPVHDRRTVRSSSGHVSLRLVVLLDLALAGRIVPAEVTLSQREAMGFRMLVGREALRQGYVVDPSRSFAGGKPPKRIRRRNRGR